MADFIKNNGDLIKSILTIITASIPLLIAVVALLRNRTEKTNEGLDTNLKVLKISRIPVSETTWEKIKRRKYSIYKTTIIITILISILVIIFIINLQNTFLTITTIILLVSAYSLYILYYSFTYINLSDTAKEVAYFIFNNAVILIEANEIKLFNKCHYCLRIMGYKVVEVDRNQKIIEAIRPPSFLRFDVKVKVLIKENTESKNVFSIEIIPSDGYLSLISECKIINQYINLLISEPKAIAPKEESKIDTNTEVGD